MKLDKKLLAELLPKIVKVLNRYAVVWFLLLLACVYGFVLFQINSANNARPSDADVAAREQGSTTPRIDPKVVNQILTLQDHSVSVKTLFEQARQNPFSE